MRKLHHLAMLALCATILFACKKKDSGNDNQNQTPQYLLVIENGAMGLAPDDIENYTVYFVDAMGNKITADNVEWSVNDNSIGTIGANGAFTVSGVGTTSLTAKATKDGIEYTASVPVAVNAPSLFAVAPMAYIGIANESVLIETVYLSIDQSTLDYTFKSSDEAIASVNSEGLVTLKTAGACTITVEGKKAGSSVGSYSIPVMCVSEPAVELPVTSIGISPAATDLFRDEKQQFTAQAYSLGQTVSADFTWSITDATVASVDQNGNVTPIKPGRTLVKVSASGISAQAEVIVNTDTIIGIDPLVFTVAPGKTKQLTANVYKINRTSATKVGSAKDVTWEIPQYGMSVFDVATIDKNGLVSAKSNATAGMTGIVLAYLKGASEPSGGASFSIAMASDCECGNGDANVASLVISQGSEIKISQMDMNSTKLSVVAQDASGATVSGATIKFCSDNMQVITVEADGTLIPAMEGTATVSACNGNISKDITVIVTGMSSGGFGF